MIRINVDTTGYQQDFNISRLKYVLDFISNHPSSPEDINFSVNEKNTGEGINISYSEINGDVKFWIKPNYIYFKKNPETRINVIHKKYIFNEIELIGFCNYGSADIIPFDIFETIFFHISRYEEWFFAGGEKDKHGTMRSKAQFLVKNHLHHSPVVDHLVYYFYASLGLTPKKLITTFSLTHDIDFIRKFSGFFKFLKGYGNILFFQKSKLKNIILHTQHYILFKVGKRKDTYDTFQWLLVYNESITQKVIYFLTGGKTKYEGFFDINSLDVKNIIEQAKEKGYRIGLHPSYNSMNELDIIREELEVLTQLTKENIELSRQHYLRFDPCITTKLLDSVNIKSDSSLGYRDLIGFRCGTGFPYHLYDFENERAFKCLEVPLVVMDVAGMRECGGDSSKWVKLISEFMAENRYYTHITFNFHNSFFDPVVVDVGLLKKWYLQQFGT